MTILTIAPTSQLAQLRALFQDPISLDLLADPVTDPCGHTFSREHIERWVQSHHRCPLSQRALEVADLVSNVLVTDALALLNSEEIFSFTETDSVPSCSERAEVTDSSSPLSGRTERSQETIIVALAVLRPNTVAGAIGDCCQGKAECVLKC